MIDPSAGSDITLIAARDLGQKAIGYEIDHAYYLLIIGRLAELTTPHATTIAMEA